MRDGNTKEHYSIAGNNGPVTQDADKNLSSVSAFDGIACSVYLGQHLQDPENMSLLTGACQVPTPVSFQGALLRVSWPFNLGIWNLKFGIN
jgi:hypothetical protein